MEWMPCPKEEMDYLAERDAVLGAAIARIGPIRRERRPEPFVALCHSIVSQLISRRAADTVYARLEALCENDVTPERLSALPVEAIKACGLSMRKAENIQNLARRTQAGELDFAALSQMEDGEVIRILSALPGIGVWTVEMLLLFSMGRGDILSYSDLGIRGGMKYLYGDPELTKKLFEERRKIYAPYGSTASLYFWALWAECQAKNASADA